MVIAVQLGDPGSSVLSSPQTGRRVTYRSWIWAAGAPPGPPSPGRAASDRRWAPCPRTTHTAEPGRRPPAAPLPARTWVSMVSLQEGEPSADSKIPSSGCRKSRTLLSVLPPSLWFALEWDSRAVAQLPGRVLRHLQKYTTLPLHAHTHFSCLQWWDFQ